MRILFLTSRLPYPPHRGDRVRTYNFLRTFSAGHDVHLLSFVEGEEDRAAAGELDDLCTSELVHLGRGRSLANIATHALSTLPYQALYYHSRRMRTAVRRALTNGGFDLVYVHLFRMVPFVLPALERRETTGIPAVLDLTDSVASEIELSLAHRPLATRAPYAWECRKIRALERRALPAFREAWVISEADRDDILRTSPGARIEIVPNGVDESLFDVAPAGSGSSTVVFVGNLSVAHNIDAVRFLIRDVMPRVRTVVPEADLRVVGKDAVPAVRDLCAGVGWCELRGFVPDLRDAYRDATVFAAPLRFAAGVQNKMLEAMAAAVPVVSSRLGNRGLRAAGGRQIVIADGAGDFAAALARVIRDVEARRTLAVEGRRFVRECFSWAKALERVELVAERRVVD